MKMRHVHSFAVTSVTVVQAVATEEDAHSDCREEEDDDGEVKFDSQWDNTSSIRVYSADFQLTFKVSENGKRPGQIVRLTSKCHKLSPNKFVVWQVTSNGLDSDSEYWYEKL
jgi:hypothetical protein